LNQISLQEVERRLDQGVRYFQNVKNFYVTRVSVIVFKPTRKVWPSLRWISGKLKMLNRIAWRFMVPIPSKLENKYENCVWKFIYARKYPMALTAPVVTELAFT